MSEIISNKRPKVAVFLTAYNEASVIGDVINRIDRQYSVFVIDDGSVDKTADICKRKGAVMSTFTLAPEQLDIIADADALGLYQFGTKVAKHFFCKECGIYPFHETMRQPGHFRVNLGCVDDVDTFTLPVEIFDGKSL